jgi:hypothetical protein
MRVCRSWQYGRRLAISVLYHCFVLINWLYIITCKKCGYISSEKSPESKAKEMIRSHFTSHENCTREHIKLVKVRA